MGAVKWGPIATFVYGSPVGVSNCIIVNEKLLQLHFFLFCFVTMHYCKRSKKKWPIDCSKLHCCTFLKENNNLKCTFQ